MRSLAYPRGYVILRHMKHTQTSLTHHISRLEGQLESIKRALAAKDPDCERMARTLKAASRSFSTLRMSFIACFLDKKYARGKSTTKNDTAYAALLEVINS